MYWVVGMNCVEHFRNQVTGEWEPRPVRPSYEVIYHIGEDTQERQLHTAEMLNRQRKNSMRYFVVHEDELPFWRRVS